MAHWMMGDRGTHPGRCRFCIEPERGLIIRFLLGVLKRNISPRYGRGWDNAVAAYGLIVLRGAELINP